jgi:riboflavin synthase
VFTGIVEELGTVTAVDDREGLRRLTVASAVASDGLRPGDSVAVNGVCLTAVAAEGGGRFTAEVVPETLRRTNLDRLTAGSRVNLERSMPADGRFGGHLVQGHVDGTVTLADRRWDGRESDLLTFEASGSLMRYVVEKGYVAVDGVSLTVVEAQPAAFTVALIPYTIAVVSFGQAQAGYVANLEVDILAKYVERLVTAAASRPAGDGVSLDALRAAGFGTGEAP